MQEELIEMLEEMVKYFDEIPSDSYYYRETAAILDEAEKLVEKAKNSAKEPAVPQGVRKLTLERDALREKCRELEAELAFKDAAPSQPVTLTDEEINRSIYEHTKLNPNQAYDAELLAGVRAAIRAIIAALREKEQTK